ncbi:ChrR Cupin-like domain-containing protein [Alteribacillus persepolensis]|uniref:ChrR Cupin-like domain-containing protein n=1 Tax=Alteribacillus persepolensis TaxID=568899 RepID=A0A1G8IVP3_9BACI|nr:cupin domain-containing protein [Alteribacillus persepolensis]SDI22540.1 ChrR Cupin-like domain-containing protein [Alteribacillus persepolensis]
MSQQNVQEKESRYVSNEKAWKALPYKGVYIKNLYKFPEGGSTVLIKMEPNSSFPLHDHPADEEVFVLEGECKVGKYQLYQGDYLFTPQGTIHAPFTREGCTLFARTIEALTFLNTEKNS